MNYFEPWKRKFGLVTLLCAFIFLSGWIRCHLPDELRSELIEIREAFTAFLLWLLIIPLTLLSAWLLLSNPQNKTDKRSESKI